MHLPCTLTIQTGKKLNDKAKGEITKKVKEAFLGCGICAIQIVFEAIRVTFASEEDYKRAKTNSDIYLFGLWCPILGGGPPVTILHVFDYPFEESDEAVKGVMKDFGELKKARKQTYLSDDTLYTGTKLVHVSLTCPPPRFVTIDGYFCPIWYKGQPLVCNLCAKQGHRSATCLNKDKWRRCSVFGHFARNCPNPWGPNQDPPTEGADVEDSGSGSGKAASDGDASSPGVLGRMAHRIFTRTSSSAPAQMDAESSAQAQDASSVPPTPTSSQDIVASNSSQASENSASQSILQDAQIVHTDSMEGPGDVPDMGSNGNKEVVVDKSNGDVIVVSDTNVVADYKMCIDNQGIENVVNNEITANGNSSLPDNGGPARWKLNVSILSNDDFILLVKNFWLSRKLRKPLFRDLQSWWDKGKAS